MTDHRKGIREAGQAGALRAVKAYQAQNPEASVLRVKTEVNAYKPRPKEVRDLPVNAVGLFLRDPASLQKSNAAIADELGREVGRKVPANILTEKLGKRQAAAIKELLTLRNVDLDLVTHCTPSKIKKALLGVGAAQKAGSRFHGEVTFSEEAVTVGERRYPIQRGKGVPRIEVGRSKINVEVLHRLLCEPS